MVTTRSGKEIIRDSCTKEKKTKIKPTKKKLKFIKLNFDDLEDNNNDDSEDNDESSLSDTDIDDMIMEETYPVPKEIEKKPSLVNYYQKLVKKIKNKEPNIEKILNAKIRLKRKVDLIQEYFIFMYTYPYSEERLFFKKKIVEKMQYYKREYKEFRKHKQKYFELEKIEKDDSDMMTIKSKLLELDTSPKNIQILFRRFSTLESKTSMDDEYYKALNWMKSCLLLPFNRIKKIPFESEISKFLLFIRNELDKELYGMSNVKEQLLLYVHNRLLNPNTQNIPLCLLGPPGIGKTSISLVLSRVLNLPFEQINMGGATNSEFLLGFESCYVGSKPGRIANALIQSGYKNTILFFDEFDKATENNHIVNSMLHITDPVQNKSFRDHFFGDIEIDLSNCWFIMSMNSKPLDKALDDRLFYIHISEYSEKEKFYIVRNYLIPKTLTNFNLSSSDVIIDDETIRYMIKKVSSGESGIRLLKQTINDIFSKILFLIKNKTLETSFSLNTKEENLELPFKISKTVMNQLIKEKKERINPSILHMYI